MRTTAGLLILAVGAWGCSGSYEVGAIDDSGRGGRTGSGAPAGAGGRSADAVSSAGSSVGAATSSAGAVSESEDDELGPRCVPTGQPEPLSGPFATPEVVWKRLSPLIWGGEHEPPFALPDTTTYAWANDVVEAAFTDARRQLHAFGASLFVARWLAPYGTISETSLEGGWETLLVLESPALEVLLTASLPLSSDERVGVFSEQAWLAAHPGISGRGAALADVLLNTVTGVPAGIETPPADPEQTDRAWLEAAVSPSICQACHRVFDPLGVAFGHYDDVGDYRELDKGHAIDVAGSYQLKNRTIDFDGIRQLGQKLADTCDANVGLVDGFLKTALSIDEVPEGRRAERFEASSARMRQAFVRSERRSYRDLVTSFAQSPAGLSPP